VDVFCFGTESVKVFFLIYYVGCVGLWITTECGRLQVSPGEIAILPQGFRFSVNLPDGPSRGYVAEVFGTHFQLPDLGPIGT
jgi:homogentisate 1,2-dioxygenase